MSQLRSILHNLIGTLLLVGLLAMLVAIIAILFAIWSARAQEFESWLVLVVDASGSINNEEYAVQRDGYVEVLLDPLIAQALDRTAIAIVEFASSAKVMVEWTDVRDAGAAYRETERGSPGGSTCVACGLGAALQLLDGKSGKRVIDISGDGVENVKQLEVVTALRDQATKDSIEINTLALLVQREQTTYYGGYVGGSSGTNADIEKWYAELATGFAMAIASLDDLAYALRRKLFAEIVMGSGEFTHLYRVYRKTDIN